MLLRRHTNKLILILFALVFFKLYARATTLSDSVFYQSYPYIVILNDGQQPSEMSNEAFFDNAARVVFPVNNTDLPTNSQLLNELSQHIIPQLNNDSLILVRMTLRGAASPEGSVKANMELGRQRVKSLYYFITSRLRFPVTSDLLSMDTEIEDYRSLFIMMQRAGDPDYRLVKNLYDRYQHQDLYRLKQQLKAVRGGSLWKRLLRDYFPYLRTARFVLYFRKVKLEEIKTSRIASDVRVADREGAILPQFRPITASPLQLSPAPVLLQCKLPRRELLSIKTNLLFDFAYMPGYNRWCPIPNVAIEYYPKRGHFTFGASFDMPWWQHYDDHKFFQLRNYQLETRYYFKAPHQNWGHGSYNAYKPAEAHESHESHQSQQPQTAPTPHYTPAYTGLYLQAYAHYGIFGICFDADRGWVGEGGGAGLGLGYVLPLSRRGHWRLEFQLQAGFFSCKHDPYKYENPVDPTYHDDLYYYKWTLEPSAFRKRQYRWNWFGPTRLGITLSYDLLYRRAKGGMSFRSYDTYRSYEAYETFKARQSQPTQGKEVRP